MSNSSVPVTVRIMDSEYRVACPAEEREALQQAADYLSSQMRQIRENGKILGVERIAVMAALNIAHELLKSRKDYADIGDITNARLQQLLKKIDGTLNKPA